MQNSTTTTAVEIQSQTLAYSAPQLVSYGRVHDLTATGSGMTTEPLNNGDQCPGNGSAFDARC